MESAEKDNGGTRLNREEWFYSRLEATRDEARNVTDLVEESVSYAHAEAPCLTMNWS
jgi:hypothetical protein